MSIYAIAVVREQTGEVKVRLLAPDKAKCIDVTMNDLAFYINKNDGIRNIEYDTKNELKWKQGAIERYPIIDNQLGSTKNEDAVTIIGVADTGVQKYFKISNMLGQIVMIKAEELIEYSKLHKMTNCKLVKKGNKEFISAIEGELEVIDTQTKYKIDNDFKCLTIHIPFILSDTLEIPDNVGGRPIANIVNIKITPDSSGKFIKKLKLGKYIKDINIGLFGDMINLEEIYIPAKEVDIYESAFVYMSKLKKVYFNTVRTTSPTMFAGLKQLEEVNCIKPFGYIPSGAFSGCTNLNINSVLKDGVIIIGTKAFLGNMATKHMVIPSTVTTILDNSFEKCKSLISVDMKTEIVLIDTNKRARYNEDETTEDKSKSGLFESLGSIDMYINKNTVINKDKVASNVRILTRDASEKDKLIEKKVKKSNILGLSLDPTKIVRSNSEIADIIIAVSQQDVNKLVLDLVQQAINSKGRFAYGTYELGGFKVRMSFNCDKRLSAAKKVENLGKFLLVKGKQAFFIPLDQSIIRNQLLTSNTGYQLNLAMVQLKYLQSVDVSDTGKIRLIYKEDNNMNVKYIDQFEIKS